MGQSDIIFAPYNYIIDPGIRKAMSINLNNSALLIDEAHNILQAARDAASIELNLGILKECHLRYSDFTKFIQSEGKKKKKNNNFSSGVPLGALMDLEQRLKQTVEWIESEVATLHEVINGQREKCLSGQNMIDSLLHGCIANDLDLKVAMTNLNELESWSKDIVKELNSDSSNKDLFQFIKFFMGSCQNGIHIMSEFLSVLVWVLGNNRQNVADFRLIVQQTLPSSHHKRKRQKLDQEDNQTIVSIKCLNAAFIFNDIKDLRTVLLVKHHLPSFIFSISSALAGARSSIT